LETINKMPVDLRKDYLLEQIDKGILTDEVQEQMVMIPKLPKILVGRNN